jgi:hypothetical protein
VLAGLLQGKLDREFWRSPAEIEDLLTSVVFGSCQYVQPGDALLRFLSEARDVHGAKLGPFIGVTSACYDFWPCWSDGGDPSSDTEADRLPGHGPDEQRSRRHEPDLVVKLEGEAGPVWVLVEAKLYTGKSSRPKDGGPVSINDQLGRYWIQFKRRADAARAKPLALVYVTLGVTLPDQDFRETQDELATKDPSAAPAPLYWLSWRDFTTVVDDGFGILRDLRALLNDWHLVRAQMRPWPAPPLSLSVATFPVWTFTRAWRWALPPAEHIEWRFFIKEQ